MNDAVCRSLRSLALVGSLLSFAAGCGVVSAVSHGSVAWVDREPASMPVVVRRADAAEVTAAQVDRLLSVPAGETDVGWIASVGPDPVSAAREMRAVREDSVYLETRAKIVHAEVWAATLPEVASAGGGEQSLLGAISPKLMTAYAAVVADRQELFGVRARLAVAPAPADAATATRLASKLRAREDDLVSRVRDAACKVPQADQTALLPALMDLTQASNDAETSNRAAALAYDRARPTVDGSLVDIVRHMTADVLREKTRVRPDLLGLAVTASRRGGHLDVVLHGLSPSNLGSVSVSEVTEEVTQRTQTWLRHVATLGSRLATTRDAVRFQQDVLREVRIGFNPNATVELPAPARIPDATSAEVDVASPAVLAPRHVSRDARSASFEGALAPLAPAPPSDMDLSPDSVEHPQG